MIEYSVEIVLELQATPALVVWERLYSSHRADLDKAGALDVNGEACRAIDVAAVIRRSGRTHFGVAWDGDRRLDYSHVTNSDLSFVRTQKCVRDEVDAEAWLEGFLGDQAFRQGRLFDEAYEYWQNASDPVEYAAAGRSHEGLPMTSNGLPFPLERQVIDVSHNPGRRVLRRGFVEAVGAPMWLGPTFWDLARSNREQVCAAAWLTCETTRGDVVRLKPADAPFSSADGVSGETQDSLRVLLYPAVT